MKKLDVTCPSCQKKFNYYEAESRPFCTEKCRMVDLGHWLTESYAVPAVKLTEEEQSTLEQLHDETEDRQNN